MNSKLDQKQSCDSCPKSEEIEDRMLDNRKNSRRVLLESVLTDAQRTVERESDDD